MHTCLQRYTHACTRAADAYIYGTRLQNAHRHTDTQTWRPPQRARMLSHACTHTRTYKYTHFYAHINTHALKHACCWIHVSSASTHTHARTQTHKQVWRARTPADSNKSTPISIDAIIFNKSSSSHTSISHINFTIVTLIPESYLLARVQVVICMFAYFHAMSFLHMYACV